MPLFDRRSGKQGWEVENYEHINNNNITNN
nr:MAG TPA: hypothetical protein [Caudoviricetes sp.]